MNRMIATTGLITLCLLITTCAGTYRAITGDYASDAPTVESITPLHGVSGEQVQFDATLCLPAGTALETDTETDLLGYGGLYMWDFGGGAEPNLSHEANPIVILRDGLRSPYNCTLTLKGSCRGEEENQIAEYTFTLSVAPLTVLGVTPTTGSANASATFSAIIGSGNVTTYAWDFGGACSPNGSNSANPQVTFIDTASGPYNCRLIISNQYELFEYPFVIQVTPAPSTT